MFKSDARAASQPDFLAAFAMVDDLWLEGSLAAAKLAGEEAHEALFGPRDLHTQLKELASHLPDVKTRFPGQVYSIGDFAVTSGHEALCCFAQTVEHFARTTRSSVPRLRGELAEARITKDQSRILMAEMNLEKAHEYFGEKMKLAFRGWREHRAWIRRGIEAELQAEATMPKGPKQRDEAHDDDLGVDWTAERARLVADGDTEGAVLLDQLLARPKSQRPLSSKILDVLNSRRHSRQTHAELQTCTDTDASTPAGACKRWRLLADWTARFEGERDGRRVIHFGGPTGPVTAARLFGTVSGGKRSPAIAWAEAFRESTSDLLPIILDAKLDDLAVQRLIQDLDDILDGQAVHLASHVREVDLQVRAFLGRIAQGTVPGGTGTVSLTETRATTPQESLALVQAENTCFLHQGDGWLIRFEGVETILKDIAGMKYIRDLLMRPGTPVPASDLEQQPVGKEDERSPEAGHVAGQSEQEVIDYLREINARLLTIEIEVAEAKSSGNEEATSKLEREKEDLLTQVRQATFQGRPRLMKSPEQDAVGRVRAAIGRAMDAIKAKHIGLWEHLNDSLIGRGGASPCYRPRSPITWQVSQ